MSRTSNLADITDLSHRGLILLVEQLTMLIDSGEHDRITHADVRAHVRDGDVLQWLKSLDPKKIDISLFQTEGGPYALAARDWLDGLDRQLSAYSPKDDFGVEKRGLCLLLILTVEQLKFEVARVIDQARTASPGSEEPGATMQ